MSSTRRATANQPLSQERYASFRSGETLLGNLVAKKCEAVKSSRYRRIILFLHDLSLRAGCRTHPTANLFPAWPLGDPAISEQSPFERVADDLKQLFPDEFKERSFADSIPKLLCRVCLDPKCDPGRIEIPGSGRSFVDLLEIYRQQCCASAPRPVAETEATLIVWETLDYALSQGGMVLIEGTWRIGKSFSAQAWSQRHLGECRYVQLSSSPDDGAFYRDVARGLGTACSLIHKASQIRMRIEAMVRTQSLMLILDESQFIWPQSLRPKRPPERVNWIMSSLLNSGVSVALIASHDFTRMMKNTEEKCPVFGSEQFHGRLRHRRKLPDELSEADLFKVAGCAMPEASGRMKMLLVGHALKSKGRLSAIESAVARARFFAAQESRGLPTFADVQRVLVEAGTIPARRARAAARPRGFRLAGAPPSQLIISRGVRPVLSALLDG